MWGGGRGDGGGVEGLEEGVRSGWVGGGGQ